MEQPRFAIRWNVFNVRILNRFSSFLSSVSSIYLIVLRVDYLVSECNCCTIFFFFFLFLDRIFVEGNNVLTVFGIEFDTEIFKFRQVGRYSR